MNKVSRECKFRRMDKEFLVKSIKKTVQREISMKEYSYTVDVSDYIIWTRVGNEDRVMYARVSGCSSRAIQAMVDALNQMEIEG